MRSPPARVRRTWAGKRRRSRSPGPLPAGSHSSHLLWPLGVAAGIAAGGSAPAAAQSPREANPERPTFATHAYAVAAGDAELEQGLAGAGPRAVGPRARVGGRRQT